MWMSTLLSVCNFPLKKKQQKEKKPIVISAKCKAVLFCTCQFCTWQIWHNAPHVEISALHNKCAALKYGNGGCAIWNAARDILPLFTWRMQHCGQEGFKPIWHLPSRAPWTLSVDVTYGTLCRSRCSLGLFWFTWLKWRKCFLYYSRPAQTEVFQKLLMHRHKISHPSP